VVVLWSRASVASDWVRSEASDGQRRGILVPVSLDAAVAPLAFRLLNGADLSVWQPGTQHPELERLVERVAEILGQTGVVPGSFASDAVATALREQTRVPPRRARYRKPLVIGGLAALILIVVGVLYGIYVIGRLIPDGGDNPLDLLPAGVATAFELKDLNVHFMFVPPESATIAGMASGAMVFRIEKGLAQAAGLHVRDVVTKINDRTIATEDDLRNAINTLPRGRSRYTVRRAGDTLTLEIDCPTCER